MRRAVLLALCLTAGVAAAEPAITARSVGYDTTCAEMDNVLVELSGENVAGFHVRATHPGYLAAIEADVMAPDFTDCDFPPEPYWYFDAETRVLYEDDRVVLMGHRLGQTWRPEEVDVVVGDDRFATVHLTQLFVKVDGQPIEVLVLYPNDGYWRPRPLPPRGRTETGFGASVLFGPIEVDRRPLVKLREVRFDPATLTYHLAFARGGAASVRLAAVGRDGLDLEVRFDSSLSGPIAMLSSMYVAEDNADVARLAVRGPGQPFWQHVAIPDLETSVGTAFRFGRDVPSRHNTSAPDVAIEGFVQQQ